MAYPQGETMSRTQKTASAFSEDTNEDARHSNIDPITQGTATAAGGAGASYGGRRPSDSSDDNVVTKTAPARKKTRKEQLDEARKGTASHFKQNWIWYFLGLIIVLAILLPILFKVILPAIVQLIVNQQNLPILGGTFITQGTDLIQINLNSSFKSPLPARVGNFSLYLYNKETPEFSPFLHLDVPEIKIDGDTKFFIADQQQTITNGSEFTKWFGHFFDEEEVKLDVRGSGATINLGILQSEPTLDKSVYFKGLNKLKGVEIQKIQLLLPAQQGKNLKGTINVPNASPLELGLGDSTFNIKSGNLTLGYITLVNAVLKTGNNSQAFEGYLDLNTIVSNLSPFLASQSRALGDGKIELNVTGNNTMKNGQRLTYLENVINNRTLTTQISIVTLISEVISSLLGSNGGGLLPGGTAGAQDGSGLINTLSGVFGNNTLIQQVVNHWNSTAPSTKPKRSQPPSDEALAWSLLSLGLKMGMKMGK